MLIFYFSVFYLKSISIRMFLGIYRKINIIIMQNIKLLAIIFC